MVLSPIQLGSLPLTPGTLERSFGKKQTTGLLLPRPSVPATRATRAAPAMQRRSPEAAAYSTSDAHGFPWEKNHFPKNKAQNNNRNPKPNQQVAKSFGNWQLRHLLGGLLRQGLQHRRGLVHQRRRVLDSKRRRGFWACRGKGKTTRRDTALRKPGRRPAPPARKRGGGGVSFRFLETWRCILLGVRFLFG